MSENVTRRALPAGAAAPKPNTEPTTEKPEWLETPAECEYQLVMWDAAGNGGTTQEVEISRAEYIALKEHLAELRGVK